ncbi:5-formyltetrahydrofolate cyclo-ligase [Candidatus Endolissoclinum faulkneri L5]|uniref:5-formyltetrahydrofolate cyclo-ligase n=1 Tax=Candidatus Endolissoclinum faulkneri L5 TaxID=1401328 RepID=V9TSE4_9PROT|nr:5-formyltetrahydrofolate cyclo-ligase [Candidatus Endolissoclinum faulkneri]AHC73511.1 5-formyltetrahydrofolate cyclo-ligase [Candidatus Endolissoclinum faulkneri L5]
MVITAYPIVNNLIIDKINMRKQIFRLLERLSAEAMGAGHKLVINLFEALSPCSGMVVSGYWPMRYEINLLPCLNALCSYGCRTALPVILPDEHVLIFRAWAPGDQLVKGLYGTLEPSHEAEVVYPTLLLVPLVAFDRSGNRLGYGGGYYDKTLVSLREWLTIQAIGVAYAVQEVDCVPVGAHDVMLNGFLTENGFIEISE